jgi:D-alanyl-D-alanine carboxypeptidase
VAVVALAAGVVTGAAIEHRGGAAPDAASSASVAPTPSQRTVLSAPAPATPARPTPTPTRTTAGDPEAARVDTASSLLVVVNKRRPFHPKDYAPKHLVEVAGPSELLRPEAATALAKLFTGAAKAKHPLRVHSAYRSYPVQASTYEGWVDELGKKKADDESARAGYSEHQSGLALDVLPAAGQHCQALTCFGSSAQATWLAANAYRYGFVVRYQKGDEKITGYTWEPWHIRYVGVPVATDMHRRGITTLEQYFGLPAAPGY